MTSKEDVMLIADRTLKGIGKVAPVRNRKAHVAMKV
jgi:hypothetical protein